MHGQNVQLLCSHCNDQPTSLDVAGEMAECEQNLFKQDNHVLNNAHKKRKAVCNSTMNRKEEEKKKNMNQQMEVQQIMVSVKSAISCKM